MRAAQAPRLLHTAVIWLSISLVRSQYRIPDVSIQALKPKGIRVSIPDHADLALFTFQGNINKDITNKDVGSISGEVFSATDGRWVFEDPSVGLKVGDVINYYVFASVKSLGYLSDKLTFKVTQLEDRSSPAVTTAPAADCRPTATVVRGSRACAGQVVFEDHFDRLNEDLWQIEQYIPAGPEFPFVSYQRPAVRADGNLVINAMLQQDMPGFTNDSIYDGTLNLFSGCTASADLCVKHSSGASILPPVVTGRVTSKVAFTYGVINIRAKFPSGDWIYPDLSLEPFMSKYGTLNYASGLIRIAAAKGNRRLPNQEVGDDEVLYAAPIMDFKCRDQLMKRKSVQTPWSDQFHTYSLKWTPKYLSFLVDGTEWYRLSPPNSLLAMFPRRCELSWPLLATGSKMAPFDDHFQVALGLSVGGITEFSDSSHKPWTNSGRKASYTFWQELPEWLPTWTQPALAVDSVQVIALDGTE